jgi:hypothetical protein
MSNEHEQYIAYFAAQADGRGVGGNFKSVRYQKGNGIGSFFSGLFRKMLPYIKSGASAIGNELLDTGVGLLRDHINNADPRSSIKNRLTSAGNNLSTKASNKLQSMLGLGYKKRRIENLPHSCSSDKKRKVAPSQKRKVAPSQNRKRDIFGF